MARPRRTIWHKGEEITFIELSRRTGIGQGALRMRYDANDRGDMLVRPVRPMPLYRARAKPKRKETRVMATHGRQQPMDLRPRDRSLDPVLAWWNNTVAPWARGERA